MLILPNTDSRGALKVAENTRLAIEALNIKHPQSSVSNRITVSVGSATTQPGKQNSIEELIYAADQALYKAKQSGRNQVKTPQPE